MKHYQDKWEFKGKKKCLKNLKNLEAMRLALYNFTWKTASIELSGFGIPKAQRNRLCAKRAKFYSGNRTLSILLGLE